MKNKAGIMARYIKPIKVKYSPMYLRYFPSKMNKGEITFPLLNSMGIGVHSDGCAYIQVRNPNGEQPENSSSQHGYCIFKCLSRYLRKELLSL